MNTTALILGYGIFDSENTQYKIYLDRVSEILQERKFDTAIFCGGKTNAGTDISEAGSMAEYIKSTNSEIITNIITEDASFSTYENITFAKQKIGAIHDTSITIICDSIRIPKVICYALRELQDYTQEETMMFLSKDMVDVNILEDFNLKLGDIEFQGVAMERTKRELADQIVGSLIQANYPDHPSLNKEFVNYRAEKWGFGKEYFENRNEVLGKIKESLI